MVLHLHQAQILRFFLMASEQVLHADHRWITLSIQTSGKDRYQEQMPIDNKHRQYAYMDWPSPDMNKMSRIQARYVVTNAIPIPRKHHQCYLASRSSAVS